MKKTFEKIALVFVVLFYKFLNFLLVFLKFLLFWRTRIPKNIKKILIFRTGNIGDTICAVPSMAAIRENYPQAEIILLSSSGRKGMPGAKELLEGAIFLNELIIYYQEEIKNFKGVINLIKKLKKMKFDLFIELPQNLTKFRIETRNIFFAKIIGVKYAFGFKIDTLKIFPKIQSKYLEFENEVDRLSGILKKEGLKINKISFPLPISEKDKQIVNNFLNQFDNKKFIVLNPNAKRQTNRWPLDRFAETGRWSIKNYNIKILIIGGEKDKQRTERLEEMIGEKSVNIGGKFTLLQTIELLKYCQLLVSNDTGAIHMACAVKTPVIGIYSARDFKSKWYPYGKENIVLRKEPKCHTCFKERCDALVCLKMIKVGEVCKSIEKLNFKQIR